MTTDLYHYLCEQDNDNEWGFFIYLETDNVILSNTLFDNYESTYYDNLNTSFDNYESTYYDNLNTDSYESSYYENTNTDSCDSTSYENSNTDRCELFNVIKKKIEYFTIKICISVIIIYRYFNTNVC